MKIINLLLMFIMTAVNAAENVTWDFCDGSQSIEVMRELNKVIKIDDIIDTDINDVIELIGKKSKIQIKIKEHIWSGSFPTVNFPGGNIKAGDLLNVLVNVHKAVYKVSYDLDSETFFFQIRQ